MTNAGVQKPNNRMNHMDDHSDETRHGNRVPVVCWHISSRPLCGGLWSWGLMRAVRPQGLCQWAGISHASDGPTRQMRGHSPSRQNFSSRRMDSGQKGQVGARGGARHGSPHHAQDCRLLGKRPGPHRAAPGEWPPCLLERVSTFQPFSVVLMPPALPDVGACVRL